MRKSRPNDPCPCRSGSKYKKCCGQSPIENSLRENRPSTIQHQNLLLIEVIEDVLGLRRGRSWRHVQDHLSHEQVRDIHKAVALIWPRDSDPTEYFPAPGAPLRAFFVGSNRPEDLPRNVWRVSLYADEIWVPLPFRLPWRMRPHVHPVGVSGEHLVSTLHAAYYMLQLKPWVEAGIVFAVPSIGEFDHNLGKYAQDCAFRRIEEMGLINQPDFREPSLEPQISDLLLRTLAMSPQNLYGHVVDGEFPDLSPEERADIVKILRRVYADDPLVLRQSLDKIPEQLTWTFTGDHVETALAVCNLIGAFPYTNGLHRWLEFQHVAKQEGDSHPSSWGELSRAFQKLEFSFLDRVDSTFALRMRQEERLAGFRGFLRDLWTDVESRNEGSDAESAARDFADRLTDEHKKASEEWKQIDRDLLKWSMTAMGGAIVAGGLAVETLPALPIAGLAALLNSRWSRSKFRAKNPLAMFIDLERR